MVITAPWFRWPIILRTNENKHVPAWPKAGTAVGDERHALQTLCSRKEIKTLRGWPCVFACRVGPCLYWCSYPGMLRDSVSPVCMLLCNLGRCHAVQCSTVQRSAVRCSAAQYDRVHCSIGRGCDAQWCSQCSGLLPVMPQWTVWVSICSVMHCTALHSTALYWKPLHCTASHCTTLHCTTVHCSALLVLVFLHGIKRMPASGPENSSWQK